MLTPYFVEQTICTETPQTVSHRKLKSVGGATHMRNALHLHIVKVTEVVHYINLQSKISNFITNARMYLLRLCYNILTIDIRYWSSNLSTPAIILLALSVTTDNTCRGEISYSCRMLSRKLNKEKSISCNGDYSSRIHGCHQISI